MQHPPTAQTHIILTEDKSVSVKCVSYTHVDHQVYRGQRVLAGMHGQAYVHHKNTEGAARTSIDARTVSGLESQISDLANVVNQ